MSKRTWNKGYPPFTGWWCTKIGPIADLWRWFDAEKRTWSISAATFYTAEMAARCAAEDALALSDLIEWTNYWPKNARVPRIDPRRTR
jgi:uncharacterized protein YeaO (DUF488 family)